MPCLKIIGQCPYKTALIGMTELGPACGVWTVGTEDNLYKILVCLHIEYMREEVSSVILSELELVDCTLADKKTEH